LRFLRLALLFWVLPGCGGGEDLTLGLRLLYGANELDPNSPLRPYEGVGCGDVPIGGACIRVRLQAPTSCQGDECVDLLPPAAGDGGGDFVANLQRDEFFQLPTASANREDCVALEPSTPPPCSRTTTSS
jgi:hypothetical protein